MEELEIAPGLRDFWRAQVESVPPRHPAETDDCPSLTRFRRGALDPRNWNDAEQIHLSTCRHCQRTLSAFSRRLQHPAASELLALRLGRLPGEAAGVVQQHIEEDQCLTCTRLMRSVWFQGLLQGASALGKIETSLSSMHIALGAVSLPARAGALAFANVRDKAFSLTGQSIDGAVNITFLENEAAALDSEPGDLVAFIDADGTYAGRQLHLEFMEDAPPTTPLQANITLESWGARSGARHNFGPFREVADRLGDILVFLAVVLD